jgi:hypothetical protein
MRSLFLSVGVAGKNAVWWTDQIPGFHPGLEHFQ